MKPINVMEQLLQHRIKRESDALSPEEREVLRAQQERLANGPKLKSLANSQEQSEQKQHVPARLRFDGIVRKAAIRRG